jgi:NAD/NADP transhydrogenase alpha subunit
MSTAERVGRIALAAGTLALFGFFVGSMIVGEFSSTLFVIVLGLGVLGGFGMMLGKRSGRNGR